MTTRTKQPRGPAQGAPSPKAKREAARPQAPEGLPRTGDLAAVRDLFTPKPKRTVTLPLTLSARTEIASTGQGLSEFIEAAILGLQEDIATLWNAAYAFCRARRANASEDAIENASARISEEAFDRLESTITILEQHGVKGVTRARVLSGFIALHLERSRAKAAAPHRTKARIG